MKWSMFDRKEACKNDWDEIYEICEILDAGERVGNGRIEMEGKIEGFFICGICV